MVSLKTLGLAVLQVAAVTAELKCYRGCNADNDALLQLLGAEPGAASFCGEFLRVGTSTVALTVTPTVIVSETITETSITITTDLDSSTITVPAPPISTFTAVKNRKRDVPYPVWLPESYRNGRVSYACNCLSRLISTPVVTSTETAEPVTSTEATATTDTVTSIYHSTVIVTSITQPSAPPAPSLVAKRAMIQVFRKSTSAAVGWLYMSNGPAIASESISAAVFGFSVLEGATSTSQVRISSEGHSPTALGFNTAANQILENYYGGFIADTPTPPGSPPVIVGSNKYETDIWILDTTTKEIRWQWIESDGTVGNVPYLYRIGGRMYPVGNVVVFITNTGGVSVNKYEVTLKYVEI